MAGLRYSVFRMRKPRLLAAGLLLWPGFWLISPPEKPVWPLTLREGLPASLPGYAAAPTEALPEEDENEMGSYTEVARFFQRIESKTSTRQFRIAIQDYSSGKDLLSALRAAVVEARRAAGVEAREAEISGHKSFVVTDHSQGRPTTLVTVIVTPSRLVLGQGANVTGDEAVQLVKRVDFAAVAAVKR